MSGRGGVGLGWGTLIVLLALAVPSVIVALISRDEMKRRTFGTVTSSGKGMGDWVMDVDRCQTGMQKGFFGAQLYSSKQPALAVWMVEDPLHGTTASINSTTGGDAVNMDRQTCAVLRGETHNDTSGNARGLPFVSGEYDFDCSVEDSHVVGHVEFKSCR